VWRYHATVFNQGPLTVSFTWDGGGDLMTKVSAQRVARPGQQVVEVDIADDVAGLRDAASLHAAVRGLIQGQGDGLPLLRA
jgi:hypothetical protein